MGGENTRSIRNSHISQHITRRGPLQIFIIPFRFIFISFLFHPSFLSPTARRKKKTNCASVPFGRRVQGKPPLGHKPSLTHSLLCEGERREERGEERGKRRGIYRGGRTACSVHTHAGSVDPRGRYRREDICPSWFRISTRRTQDESVHVSFVYPSVSVSTCNSMVVEPVSEHDSRASHNQHQHQQSPRFKLQAIRVIMKTTPETPTTKLETRPASG